MAAFVFLTGDRTGEKLFAKNPTVTHAGRWKSNGSILREIRPFALDDTRVTRENLASPLVMPQTAAVRTVPLGSGSLNNLGFLEDVLASGESLERLLLLLGTNNLEGVHGAGSTIVHLGKRSLTARADHTCEWFE